MKIQLAVSLMLVATLSSCATSYGPRGLSGGYTDMKVGEGLWRVEYRGNGQLGPEGTEAGFLRRCAELVKESGHTYFAVARDNGGVMTTTTPVTMGTGTAVTRGQVDPLSGRYTATTEYSAPDTIQAKKYRVAGTCRALGSNEPGSMDAAILLEQFKD